MKCIGPACKRAADVLVRKLCSSHYRQHKRGRPLTPLRANAAEVWRDQQREIRRLRALLEAK